MIEVGTKCVVEVVVSLSLLQISRHLLDGNCFSSLLIESQTRRRRTFLVFPVLGVACDGLLKAATLLCMICKPGFDVRHYGSFERPANAGSIYKDTCKL
jgi:hypothetical protein